MRLLSAVLSLLAGAAGASPPEVAARAHLRAAPALRGFGLTRTSRPDDFVVRFTPTLHGLPVLGRSAAVRVEASGAVSDAWVDPLPGSRGAPLPAVGRAELAGLSRRALGHAPAASALGYAVVEGKLMPAAELTVFTPAPEWVLLYAGRPVPGRRTGDVLARGPLTRWAGARLYERSPAVACPGVRCLARVEPDALGRVRVWDRCAPLVETALPEPTVPGRLTSASTAAYNCLGQVALNEAAPERCPQTAFDGGGDFSVAPDPTHARQDDAFSEVMAYRFFHQTEQFLKALDPSYPGIGFTAIFTNLRGRDGAGALTAAPYSQFRPSCSSSYPQRCVVMGQGTDIDGAYDGERVMHEVWHAASWTSARFGLATQGATGAVDDPSALDEGLGDYFAVAQSGDPTHAEYSAGEQQTATTASGQTVQYFLTQSGFYRDARLFKTCEGDGRRGSIWRGARANAGLDGEPHRDGEIVLDFLWALREGLAGVDPRQVQPGQLAPTCGPAACDAASVAAFRTLRVTGTTPTFTTFTAAVAARVRALYGAAAGDFADCLVERHGLAACEGRAVPLFRGEEKSGQLVTARVLSGVAGRPAQPVAQLQVPSEPGATALELEACAEQGQGTLYLRAGAPVSVQAGRPAAYDWAVPVAARPRLCNRLAPGGSRRLRTFVTLDAAGCRYSGYDTSDPANDGNPPLVPPTPCAAAPGGGSAHAGQDWYLFHASALDSPEVPTYVTRAGTGAKLRPAVAPRSCAGLVPAAGRCAPLCDGKACGQPDDCGGSCAPGSGCWSTLADGGRCEPLCDGLACGAPDECGGTCAPGSGCAAVLPAAACAAAPQVDAGGPDAGTPLEDAGGPQGTDAGAPDAGAPEPGAPGEAPRGCGCAQAPGVGLLALVVWGLRRGRRGAPKSSG